MTLDETLKKQIEEEVINITAEELGKKPNEITRNLKFIEDLGSDSLTQVELIMRFEEKYGLTIKDEEAQKMQTVGNAVDYVFEQYKRKQIL
ncbi:acyl carrier protein [Candidatus Pacearchaeota archaeon]|nr:acyl carrier protein [Candidatus Pacearchaeota archaeon]